MIKRTGKDEYAQGVRYLDTMTIFFKDKESIYIRCKNNNIVVIANRWWDKGRGRYSQSWRPFQQKLKTSPLDSIYSVIRLANRYDIGIICSTRPMPEIPKRIKVY